MGSPFHTSSIKALKRYLSEGDFAFTQNQEAVWREFVNASAGHEYDLDRDFLRESILNGDYQMCFKRRMLLTYLIPARELVSFYCPAQGRFYFVGPSFTISPSDIEKKIPSDLYQLAAELVCAFKYFLENNRDGVMEIKARDVDDLLYDYNKILIELLVLVPEECQEQVYNHISLHSAVAYYGYEPFIEMMRTGGNEKWKRSADFTMRQCVVEELEGRLQPTSGNSDSAVSWYLRLVLDVVNCELGHERALSYSLDLLADQLAFIEKNVRTHKEKMKNIDIYERTFGHYMDIYKPIRKTLARILVLSHKGSDMSFIWHSSDRLKFAKELLAEFGHHDSELCDELTKVIPIAEDRIANDQKKAKVLEEAKKAKKQSILLRMKNAV